MKLSKTSAKLVDELVAQAPAAATRSDQGTSENAARAAKDLLESRGRMEKRLAKLEATVAALKVEARTSVPIGYM